jgi:glycosyltransferase involved in cell wall biosynthesis
VLQERIQTCLLLISVKILYVSQYFPPEMGAPAARASELAHHWAAAGHDVTILTGFPNHPTGIVHPDYRRKLQRLVSFERLGKTNVVRTWLFPFPNRKSYERILNYSSFFASAASTGMFLSRPDVSIATSPQLLVALAGWWLSRIKHVPFVFEVRDLWPESLTAVGLGNPDSLLHKTLGHIAGFLYRNSEHIVVVTSSFRDFLVENWGVPSSKISVIENGVETDLFRPRNAQQVRRELAAYDKFVVSYIGTMGMAHGLETVIDAAVELQRTSSNVLFLLIGEGSEKKRVMDMAHSRGLNHLRFLDQQPRDKIPDYISASDACLVPLKRAEVFKTVIPTKLLECMSCARPVILGVDGTAREILDSAQAGIYVEPENAAALADAITRLASSPAQCNILGQNGRKHILAHFSRKMTAQKYISVLETLLGKAQKGISAAA